MREFEVVIDEALTRGLRQDRRTQRNSQVLTECLGFRIGNALEGLERIIDPTPESVDMFYNWPFPQVLVGESYRILIVRDDINQEDVVYSLNSDYSVATQIFAVDQLTFGQGTLMELADFGEYAFMTNGVIMLYWDPSLLAWDKKTSIATIPMMRAVCNFKGRMIGGCVLSVWHDCDEKSIVWSKVGEANFTPGQDNTAGYRRDPFGGEVYHVRRLEDNVVIYSSKGVSLMYPVSDPTPTFGFKELKDVEVINRGAVGGNLNEHVFVDSDYYIWKLNDKGLNKLGYKEYMENLTGGDIIINYNSNKGDYYISDGTTSYLLTSNGLTEHPNYSSAIWYDEGLKGLPGLDYSSDLPYLTTHVIDMGYRAMKTIFSVELGGIGGDAEVSIYYRNNINEAFEQTDYIPINNMGIASITISGVEFMISIRNADFTTSYSDLDYITIRWKMTDLRGLRGIYAAPPRGQ